jgi:hypothetical protein
MFRSCVAFADNQSANSKQQPPTIERWAPRIQTFSASGSSVDACRQTMVSFRA